MEKKMENYRTLGEFRDLRELNWETILITIYTHYGNLI